LSIDRPPLAASRSLGRTRLLALVSEREAASGKNFCPSRRFPAGFLLPRRSSSLPEPDAPGARQVPSLARRAPIEIEDTMNTIGDFRATCNRCGWRFCWTGSVFDMPPCPGCGQAMTIEERRRVQFHMESEAQQNALKRLTRTPLDGTGGNIHA
jgi:hypothetical protein